MTSFLLSLLTSLLQDFLDSLLDKLLARPDIDWCVAEYEDLVVTAEVFDSLPSPTFEVREIALRFRTSGLKLARVAVSDAADPPPESSSSALSRPESSTHDPSTAVNTPSVCPFSLSFVLTQTD